jgi:sialic acid synthase SpsE
MLETQPNYLGIEIIAEAGCNHGGDLSVANDMIRVAKECGANTIKFQSFVPEKLVNADDVLEWCKTSSLSYMDHAALIDECEDQDIKPMFSAFDMDSLEMLVTLGMEEIKIPSGQVFNADLLSAAARNFKRVYLSTGMCNMSDVRKAFHTLTRHMDRSDIVVMQCTTAYPAPHCDANLLVLERYRKEFGGPVGYSDHTLGWAASIAAIGLGATVIEKHFCLNNQQGPDICVSLTPVEFRWLVNHAHEARAARGTQIKRPRQCEEKMFKRKDFGGSK